MTFSFRPAIREQTHVLIALAGASGCGKTFSALRLARGLVGETGKIAVIDTEAGRALHYADRFKFDHGDLAPPFRPENYLEAIIAAEAAGYGAVVIDSMSHEYEGEGGIMEWADEIEKGGVKSPGNWKIPKTAHKKMVNRLLQMRCHLIFCLRAEEKIKIERVEGDNGRMRTVVTQAGWTPVCEKRFMFEMTASFTLLPEKAGIPLYDLPHKCQEQHKGAFPAGAVIDEGSGAKLAEWARGGTPIEPESGMDMLNKLLAEGREAAGGGKEPFTTWWNRQDVKMHKLALKPHLAEFQAICAKADTTDDGKAA